MQRTVRVDPFKINSTWFHVYQKQKRAIRHERGIKLRIYGSHNLFIMIIALLMCIMFKGGFRYSEYFLSSQIRLCLHERCLHFYYYSQKTSLLPFSFILVRVWKFTSMIRGRKSWMNRNEKNFSFVRIFSSTQVLCVLWLIHKITEISDVTWTVKLMILSHVDSYD